MKIKLFEGTKQTVEQQVNAWLVEHDKDVQIVNMFVTGTSIATKETYALHSVTFIYRELVDPGNPAEGKEPQFK